MRPTHNIAADRGNFAVVLAMSLGWITPTLHFWGAVAGVVRPFSDPQEDVAPSLIWFLVGLAACFAPCALPDAYYRPWEGPRAMRVYEAIGVRWFKRHATNGDRINRKARRIDPRYRVVRDESTARAWAGEAREAERNHLVFLSMGLLSTIHAVRIGWYGWAAGMTAGNLVFNLYPVLLQRYTRLRLQKISRRWPGDDGAPRTDAPRAADGAAPR